MPWFPAWGIKFDKEIEDVKETLTTFNRLRPDEKWLLLAFEVAASEKHLWTAWYSMKRNQIKGKMIANSPDAEFLRIIAGTHQVRIAFENAGIRNSDHSAWIIRLPDIELRPKVEDNFINREVYNNHELEATVLIERMNGSLISQRPNPSLEGLKRIVYESTIIESKSLEECFLLHLISSNL
jgi:tRNA threonylcarbamoyladenosine modification (KEOPS) complex Cgi121 subunit